MTDDPQPQPWNNGLLASSYVALSDVPAERAPYLLTALSRARIAAYLAEAPGVTGALRLYVASGERSDARTIVAAVLRADAAEPAAAAEPPADPLAGIDTDAEFNALIADWHVDTHTAIRDAERALSDADEDWRLRLGAQPAPGNDATREADDAEGEDVAWLDEEHYVPPNPPPLPRPTAPILLGILLIIGSVMLFAFGDPLGMPFTLSLFLGVCGVITALVLFGTRLRRYRDEDDDGAVL